MSFRNTSEQKKIRREQRLERKSNFETKYGKFTHISELTKQNQQEFFDKLKMQMNNFHEHFISKILNLKDLIKSL